MKGVGLRGKEFVLSVLHHFSLEQLRDFDET